MILTTPIIIPITLYKGDDFDLQLNWRVHCGAPFDLTDYNAKMTFWPSKTDRSAPVYQITNPWTLGEGINLNDTSPNIWAHILGVNVDFSTAPAVSKWHILELQTPAGINLGIDGVWFRFAEGKVDYIV